MAAVCVIAPPDIKETFNPPLVKLIVLLMAMAPAAFNISVGVVAPKLLRIAVLTVIFPAWVPLDPVVIVTLVPPFNEEFIVAALALAVLAVGVKVFGLPLL